MGWGFVEAILLKRSSLSLSERSDCHLWRARDAMERYASIRCGSIRSWPLLVNTSTTPTRVPFASNPAEMAFISAIALHTEMSAFAPCSVRSFWKRNPPGMIREPESSSSRIFAEIRSTSAGGEGEAGRVIAPDSKPSSREISPEVALSTHSRESGSLSKTAADAPEVIPEMCVAMILYISASGAIARNSLDLEVRNAISFM